MAMGFLGKSKDGKTGSLQNGPTAVDDMPLQTKLRYGQADDAYEREADRVADSVVDNSARSATTGKAPAMAPSISNFVQKQEGDDKQDASQQETPGSEEEMKEGQNKEEGNTDEEKEPVQRKSGDKEEDKPVQKQSEDKEEEGTVQKMSGEKKEEPVQKKENDREEETDVQRKSTDNKEDEKQLQKKGETSEQKEEEKPVQKQADTGKEEEKPVQKKSDSKKDEEKPVQKKSAAGKEEEKPVQKKETNHPRAKEPDIEKQINVSKSGGRFMDDDIRKEMEKQFSKDFRNVVIHNDPMSYELCTKLNAQAFTHGNHIYFAEGKYKPDTTEGKRLLAHELTHVVQQGNELRRKMIQKDDKKSDAPTEEKKYEFTQDGLGSLKKAKNGKLTEVKLDHVKVPAMKAGFPLKGKLKYRERNTNQIKVWEDSISFGGASTKMDSQLSKAVKTYSAISHIKGKNLYFLKRKGTKVSGGVLYGILMGSKEDILKNLKRPKWDKTGKHQNYDVDHKLEWQLGGEDTAENMWMLEATQNRSSGSQIKNSLEKQLDTLVAAGKKDLGKLPSGSKIRHNNEIEVLNGVKGEIPPKGEAKAYTKTDIEGGAQLEGLEFLTGTEIVENNLLGSENKLAVYLSPTGAAKVDVKYDKKKDAGKAISVGKAFGNLTINSVTPNEGGNGGTANITLFKGKKGFKKPFTVDSQLDPSPTVQYGGVINRSSVLAAVNAMKPEVPQTSPVLLDMLDLTENGVEGSGKMMPSASIFQKLDIYIKIDEDGIWLAKTFSAPEINLPKPFKIDTCSFSIMLGAGDFKAEGIVEFGIENIGTGSIEAKGSSSGFTLSGNFKLDEKIFDGEISATYTKSGDNEKWKITGTTRFKKGAIKGVKSGSLTVGYDGTTLTADGDAELEGKWIEKGSIGAKITEDTFSFTGKFTLAKMPGLESGEGEVTVEKIDDEYQLKAKGKAKSSIKVVNAELSIEYDKGILTVNGSVAYSKGIFSGQIFVTVTNGPPPAEAPNPGGADGEFRVYGGGELTAQITSWLKGTIGVKFDENNQVIFSGKLALSSSIEVFGKKSMPEKDLFSMGFDIPIFAIPVGPKSIGLKARIEGALVAYAFIGPGTLEGVELGITFNPDKPEDTLVTGKGSFVIPAEAGLKLAVRASIGLSALIGGVEGGLELAGGLKLQASASANINVDWTPAKGLELNANLNADVTPKLTFEINGFIKAWFAWYDKIWKWNLANYEYGSNLNLGVTLPIKYKEGQDFNVSYEDIQFRKPDIDPKAVLKGLISDIRNSRN